MTKSTRLNGWIGLLALSLTFFSCSQSPVEHRTVLKNDVLSDCNIAVQNAVVVDHVAPPVGGRRYFYASVAAYESLVPFYANQLSLAGQLKDLAPISYTLDTSLDYCLDLVAMAAHTYASKALVYKEDSIANFRERQLAFYKENLSKEVFEQSLAWGDEVGKQVVAWSASDSFNYYRGKEYYLAKNIPGYWQPTAPNYMDAVEPNWGRIRTSVAPDAEFIPLPGPAPYDLTPGSRYMVQAQEVKDTVSNLDSMGLLMAKYWDDNPNATVHYGHATINILKVSPLGHWLSTYSTVARNKKLSLMESAEGMVRLSSAVYDAFILAFKAKYKYEYIRPETVIRNLWDSAWVPAIQTPSFPEYPSAHSVVSGAAGTLLTEMFGEVSYIDSAEMEFGLGTREFNNFHEAAKEACYSRLYGGIHFRDAIEHGRDQGIKLGEYHIAHLKTRK
jgi:hypothetical protein